jgi:ketosteroid isomerase-like protein
MKYIFFFCSIIICVSCIAQSSNAKQIKTYRATNVEQIKKLEYDWVKAEDFLDTAALNKILDKTYISIEQDGVWGRQQELLDVYKGVSRRIKEGISVDSFHFEDVTINVYNNTAVATFIKVTKGKNKGVPFTRKSRLYDVLVKRNGEWKAAASHVMRGLPVETRSYNQIKERSTLWNTSYNNRDSISFYTLLDMNVIITSGAARQVGKEECKYICRGLWSKRPDITWTNQQTTIEVNEQSGIAYENGNWTESWTEKGDTERSTLKGKYTIMWKKKNEEWLVSSAQFIPLSCSGSYCK